MDLARAFTLHSLTGVSDDPYICRISVIRARCLCVGSGWVGRGLAVSQAFNLGRRRGCSCPFSETNFQHTLLTMAFGFPAFGVSERQRTLSPPSWDLGRGLGTFVGPGIRPGFGAILRARILDQFSGHDSGPFFGPRIHKSHGKVLGKL